MPSPNTGPFDFQEQPSRPRSRKGSNGLLLALGITGAFVGCCVLPIGCGSFYLLSFRANPNVTRENYEKLRLGMKLREVEAIFGGSGSSVYILNKPSDKNWYGWRNGDTSISVRVDDPKKGGDARVEEFSMQQNGP